MASAAMLKSLIKTLENNNLLDAGRIGTRITDIAVALKSNLGVFVGETVESSFLQLFESMAVYQISEDEYAKEIQSLIPLVGALTDSMESGETSAVYSALLDLRFHATMTQYDLPHKYKRRVLGPRR